MLLVIAVETRGLTHVLLVSPLLASNLGRVDSGGQSDEILGFLGISLVSIVVLFLLFILLGFIGRLGILGGSGRGALRNLIVISAMIFHRSLSLDFVRGNVSRSTFSETI